MRFFSITVFLTTFFFANARERERQRQQQQQQQQTDTNANNKNDRDRDNPLGLETRPLYSDTNDFLDYHDLYRDHSHDYEHLEDGDRQIHWEL